MSPLDELDVFACPLEGINLIEASAGTGKTWNLCGLFLRLLLEKQLEVQQILVVTFTNAANAELRERIRARIAETLARLRGAATGVDPFVPEMLRQLSGRGLNEADMQRRLDQALKTFDEAAIFTIHGFCQRALADTPFSTHMPLRAELLQDDSELRDEVVHDFWRRRVASESLARSLAAHLVERGDSPQRLGDLLRRRLLKPLAQQHWPAGIDAPGHVDLDGLQTRLHQTGRCWSAERESAMQALQRGLTQLNATVYKREVIEAGALEWDAWLADDDPLVLLGRTESKAGHFGRTRLQEKTKKGCTTPTHPFFDLAQDLLDERAAARRTLALQRLGLWRELLDEGVLALRSHKRQRRVIAFDDMLFNLHQRLHDDDGPALATRLRQRFPAALIDEFQDTDPLQFGTFQALYGDGRSPLFLLGDPKQAIYSFRNADLHTYLQARRQASAEYTLRANQRSSAGLLESLNALFGANSEAFMQAGLAFHPATFGAKPRPPFIDRSAPRAALQLWRLPERDRDGQPLLLPAARQAAVDATAAEIARLLAAARRGEVQHDGRPLAAGDIAVLVRTHRQGLQTRRALEALGVGCIELSQAGVFDSVDAEELERVLAAIAEPTHSRSLKAALATECMGLDATAIDALADDPVALLDRMQRFVGWRQLWLQHGVATMLRRWLVDEQVAERLLRRSDGARRLTNLLHLMELLHAASGEHRAPEALCHWLQAQRQSGSADDSVQLRLESDRNLVQIVTVHKAKGLEYPVVFCPLLWDGSDVRSGTLDGIELHDDDGHSVIDFREGLDDGFDAKAVKARRQAEADAESLRLIYVALTRAVQRCHLVFGWPARKVRNGHSRKAGQRNLLNWLAAGQGFSAADWREAPPDVETLDAAWIRLASEQAPQIGLTDLPADHATALSPSSDDAATLAALPAPKLPGAWRIGSYSGLVHGAQNDQAALDHDLRAAPAAVIEAPPDLADDDILGFPRGPAAGECLHTLFELADFHDPGSWPAAAEATLQRHRAALPPELEPGGRQRMLLRMLSDVTDTALPVGSARPLRLAELASTRRIVEMEFHLPSHGLSAGRLNPLLERCGVATPPLRFRELQGYLKGFIDLVFEHDDRWFVLDWKSNHLGSRPGDYGGAAVAAAVAQQGYALQASLYSVALDRLLRQRLPGYRFEQHFGGALVLFVRGVRPGWRDAGGGPTGVFVQAPQAGLVAGLGALLDGDEVTA